jgi:hypothetical protein
MILLLLLYVLTAKMTPAQDSFSREVHWPPISSYTNMAAMELSTDIKFKRGDLEYLKQRSDPKSQRLTTEAQNRLDMLFKLYAERTGRSLESVLEIYK